MILDKSQINLFNFFNELIFIYNPLDNNIVFFNNAILHIVGDIQLPFSLDNNEHNMKSKFFDKEILINDTSNKILITYNDQVYKLIKNKLIYNNVNYILCIYTLSNNENYSDIDEINNILVKSVRVLNTSKNLFDDIYKILEALGMYYQAHNISINEILTKGVNTLYMHKWYLNHNSATLNNLSTSNIELIQWNELIGDSDIIFFEDIDKLKFIFPVKYSELKENGIENIAVAIMREGLSPLGFICVENIEKNKSDLNILNFLICFILSEIKKNQVFKTLDSFTFYDQLSDINNKDKYNNYLKNIENDTIKSIGIAFIDINGLGIINDTEGYISGDRAIIEIALSLRNNFRKDDLYRITGDTFVILSNNISRETFFNKINTINRHFLTLREYSVSIGYIWVKNCLDINYYIKKANMYMQHAKKNYYNSVKKHNIKIFSSMATQSYDDKVKIIIDHDSSLDFNAGISFSQPKQEIFNFKVNQMLAHNDNKRFIMVMLDINNFKVINEIHGLKIGNEILFNISLSINNAIMYKGVSCHIHSDLYYFFCESNSDEKTLDILKIIENNLEIYISNIKITLSYGIYKITDDNITVDKICKMASYAHKFSKKDPTKRINFYDNTLHENMINEKELEDDMALSLLNDCFKMYLQPKYDVQTEQIVGAEALVRWQHPSKGLLLPSSFIPLFEKNGFIINIDMYILEQVCKFLAKNNRKNRKNFPISTNMSKLNFKRNDFVQNVLNLINKYKISSHLIELEITESLIAENPNEIIKIIDKFKLNNLNISIDDFGSGYSSFSILKTLPIDILKIDCSFFKDFDKSKKASTIVKSIIYLCKELNIRTVAEGVEYKYEVDYLKKIKCDIIQGYYFSRPIPLYEFEKKAFS